MSSDYAVKQELVELSERLVDLSENLDRAESEDREKDYARAHQQLRRLGDQLVDYIETTQGDDHAFAHFMMGSLCSMMGYNIRAEESYRIALNRWPDHVGVLNELFECLYEQGKYAEARKIIERSMHHGGETPVIMRNYAAVLVQLKQINKARIVMFNCLARFPQDQESREFLEQLDTAAYAGNTDG